MNENEIKQKLKDHDKQLEKINMVQKEMVGILKSYSNIVDYLLSSIQEIPEIRKNAEYAQKFKRYESMLQNLDDTINLKLTDFDKINKGRE